LTAPESRTERPRGGSSAWPRRLAKVDTRTRVLALRPTASSRLGARLKARSTASPRQRVARRRTMQISPPTCPTLNGHFANRCCPSPLKLEDHEPCFDPSRTNCSTSP